MEIRNRKKRVDIELMPNVNSINELLKSIQNSQKNVVRARTIDDQLSSAENIKEKAILHEQCEGIFGEGSPRSKISRERRKIVSEERKYKKIYNATVDLGRQMSREIDDIILDGNNLCYANSKSKGNKFIAFQALDQVCQP